jgi:Lysozyme inhibitor LprI
MVLRRGSWGLVLLAVATMPLSAQDEGREAPSADCETLKTIPLPLDDQPSTATLASLKGCSSEALYFGIGLAKDPGRARQCAYLEREGPDNGWPNLFSGTGMLMTIYANGVGADRNFDVAMRFACELGGAPAEEEGWIAHLQKLKKENWQGQDFSPCDDITSGAAMGFCAAHEEKLADATREAKLAGLASRWSGAERDAFAALKKAMNDYVEAKADNEVDMSGTARGALSIGAKEEEEERFVAALEGLISGDLPHASGRDFAQTDAKLNALYEKLQKQRDNLDWGTVTKEGIKKTERAWLHYRDAFVGFARVKYPSRSPEDLKQALTVDRIKSLENFGN